MNYCELVNIVSFLSCLIVENYSDEQIALLSSIFVQLGDSLATILASKALLEIKKDENIFPSSSWF